MNVPPQCIECPFLNMQNCFANEGRKILAETTASLAGNVALNESQPDSLAADTDVTNPQASQDSSLLVVKDITGLSSAAERSINVIRGKIEHIERSFDVAAATCTGPELRRKYLVIGKKSLTCTGLFTMPSRARARAHAEGHPNEQS